MGNSYVQLINDYCYCYYLSDLYHTTITWGFLEPNCITIKRDWSKVASTCLVFLVPITLGGIYLIVTMGIRIVVDQGTYKHSGQH